MKKLKPETEIRNLKKRVKELEMLCEMAGVPLLVIQLPELALKNRDKNVQECDATEAK